MTNHLQPVQPVECEHLDPDQLNAFAANALPAHERAATLAHLADCPHCRQIVFLAQQDEGSATSTPKPTSNWRTWFTSTPLLGAAAAGLACTLLLATVLHLRHQPPTTPNVAAVEPQPATPAPNPQASSEPGAPRPGSPASASRLDGVEAPDSRTRVSTEPQLEARKAAVSNAPPAKSPAPIQNAGAMMAGMSAGTGAAAKPAPISNGFLAVQSTNQAPAGQMQGSGRAVTLGNAAPPASSYTLAPPQPSAKVYTGGGPLQNNQTQMAQMQSNQNQMQSNQLAKQNQLSSNAGVSDTVVDSASFTALAAPPPSPVSNQTVEISAATPSLQTQPTQTSNLALRSLGKSSAKLALATPLPSKLSAASTTTAANRTLALDTAGTLFLSLDNGRHWTLIHPQWQGKAVYVALTHPSSAKTEAQDKSQARNQAAAPQSNASSTTISGYAAPAAPAPPSPPAPLFQLTTADGKLWQSPDGYLWH